MCRRHLLPTAKTFSDDINCSAHIYQHEKPAYGTTAHLLIARPWIETRFEVQFTCKCDADIRWYSPHLLQKNVQTSNVNYTWVSFYGLRGLITITRLSVHLFLLLREFTLQNELKFGKWLLLLAFGQIRITLQVRLIFISNLKPLHVYSETCVERRVCISNVKIHTPNVWIYFFRDV